MQLIEVTDFGVRSAQITLVRRLTPLRFVLFPMRRLPVLPRLGLLALTPVVGAWLAVAGPRVALRHLETDGLPTREEIERDVGALEQVHDLLVRRRDVLLLRCLEEIPL